MWWCARGVRCNSVGTRRERKARGDSGESGESGLERHSATEYDGKVVGDWCSNVTCGLSVKGSNGARGGRLVRVRVIPS